MSIMLNRSQLREQALRASARLGLAYYQAACLARGPSLRTFRDQTHPKPFVPSPEAIEKQATGRVPHALLRIIKELTGLMVPKVKLDEVVARGLHTRLFINYGDTVYINTHRVKSLLSELAKLGELGGVALDEEKFRAEAIERGLIRSHLFGAQLSLSMQADYPEFTRGAYRTRDYLAAARDGRALTVSNTIRQFAVSGNDDRPSILLLNPLAGSKQVFDHAEKNSLVLDLADRRYWAYQFDFRGTGDNLGRSKREKEHDRGTFVDTYVSNDLPAVTEFIYHRPKGRPKPVILIGYSMGGMIAEFMVIRQAYKLNLLLSEIGRQAGVPAFSTIQHTRAEIGEHLGHEQIAAQRSREVFDDLVAEALYHLEILNSVKGIITLGSPKIFDKYIHPIYAALLMLNIILPTLEKKTVPMDEIGRLIKRVPVVANLARSTICPDNFDDPAAYLSGLTADVTSDFPLGVGLQFLMEVYAGKGFRRMGKTRFNYTTHLHHIPRDLPIHQVVGTRDILCPPFNLAFINPVYGRGARWDFTSFSRYRHERQQVHCLSSADDVDGITLPNTPSQVQGFLIANLGHLDFLEGRQAQATVRPLIHKLVEVIAECGAV